VHLNGYTTGALDISVKDRRVLSIPSQATKTSRFAVALREAGREVKVYSRGARSSAGKVSIR
jgi:hypothetical protein